MIPRTQRGHSARLLAPGLLAAGAALAFLPLAARAQQAAATTVASSLDVKPQVTETTTTIDVLGEVDLADDYVVTATLVCKGVHVVEVEAPVAQRRFSARFGPWKKILLPGKYEIAIAVLPAAQKQQFKAAAEVLKLQKDRVAFEVGSAQEQAERAESVKKKIIDVLEGLRLSYIELNQAGSFYRAELQILSMKSRIKEQSPQERDANVKRFQQRQAQLLPSWQDEAQANMEERFKTARYDWKIFREQIVASPFPDVEKRVDQLFKTLEVWFRGMNGAIYELCGQPLPKEQTEGGATDPLKLDPEIVQLAHTCYQGLGYPSMPQWKISDLSEPEKGEIKGDWYKSYVSKFMIKKPENWGFYPGGVRPSARLRFTPPEQPDPKKRSETIVVVEILDFATATDNKNLAALAREMNRNRWRNAKEIKSENLNAPDVTMPRGTRPGIDSEFLIEQGQTKIRMRYYQLFCRWHKRTYGVLCIARDEKFSELEETFRKTCSSFRVLDAPAFHDLAEKERRREIAKDGQNPEEEARKAYQFSHPDEDPKNPGPNGGKAPDPNKKEDAPK